MFTLNSKGKLRVFEKPMVMGILNINTDSFFEGSRVVGDQEIIDRAGLMIEQGAGILDIGGQSTRPGANPISAEQELERVLPAIQHIKQAFPETCLSIDTFFSKVAIQAVNAGIDIVNDISAGDEDEEMLDYVSKNKLPFIAMHKQGNPQTMQANPQYNDVVLDLIDYFKNKAEQLKNMGVTDWILDPGFGFGKTLEHNFQLLQNLESFKIFGRPIMVGISRKGMIWKTLNSSPTEALNGTTALHMAALLKGSSILRVHDVKEAVETVKMFEAMENFDS